MIDDATVTEALSQSDCSMERKPHERRMSARHHAVAPAFLQFQGCEYECNVLDISSGGVQIKGDRLPASGETVVLRFGSIGEISAKVAWQRCDRCGLQFIGDESVISELVMAIAIYG